MTPGATVSAGAKKSPETLTEEASGASSLKVTVPSVFTSGEIICGTPHIACCAETPDANARSAENIRLRFMVNLEFFSLQKYIFRKQDTTIFYLFTLKKL